jgi:RNA polymerase sigma factor (sigma-70 family)
MDRELVEQSRAGDRAAFGQLVERHQRLVFGVALAATRERSRAEDVAQEAFVSAWRELHKLRTPEQFGAWVAGIARNLARSQRRTWARRQREVERAPAPPTTDERTPYDDVASRQDRELLAECLAEVGAAHREALVLYYLEGGSIAEVSRQLGISEELMKQRLSRGRRALRQGWAERLGPALERARPGAAFTAAVLAAVSLPALTHAAPAAGKAVIGMTMAKKISVAIAVAAVGGGVAWYQVRARASTDVPPTAAAAVVPLAAAPPAATAPRPRVRRLAAGERPALLQRISAARQAAQARAPSRVFDYAPDDPRRATATRPAGAPALPPGDLDKDYIRASVRELLPMIRECYEEGLARAPGLEGTITVHFTIDGEPEVGGVIGESSIVEENTTLADAQVLECVQETMYGIEIEPPQGGGVVEVTYPFLFALSGD